MAIEIEHKFLLANNRWRTGIIRSTPYKQGYLSSNSNVSIRIRISHTEAWINLKKAAIGNQRDEYEYPIPLPDAEEIINNLCQQPLIDKTRHLVPYQQHTWEIDEFHGDNDGLIVAEIELTSSDEGFAKPDWLGTEVTLEHKYYNNQLAKRPYSSW